MVQALLQLRTFITIDLLPLWKEAWFYPEHGGVRGWQGTQDVMFAALNPSYGGRFPSPADEFLYRELKSNGFENAHLTDIIKARERNEDMPQVLKDAVYMKRQRLYLLREMDIVQPRLIVAMGKTAWNNLKAWFPDDPRIRHIPHYSWAHRYRRHKEFSERLREAHAEYRGTGRPRREPSSLASGMTASRRERVELVASECHRRGFRTSLAPEIAGTDIVASKDGASRSVRILIRANRGSRRAWLLNQKAESDIADDLVYVFVNLKDGTSPPHFYVVPSRVVAKFVKDYHNAFLARGGRPNAMRMFHDRNDEYLDRWDLLGL